MVWDGLGEGAQLTTQTRPFVDFYFNGPPNQSGGLWVEEKGQIWEEKASWGKPNQCSQRGFGAWQQIEMIVVGVAAV